MNIIGIGTVKTGLSALLLMAACALNVQAQSSDYPFEGEVTGTDVYVRSAPDLASYAVSKLSSPAHVTVTGKVAEGWYAIKPVPGCYAVVAQSFVKTDASGTERPASAAGEITGENVRIRAAGTLRRSNFDSILMMANKGEKVTIVGTVEEDNSTWYIILPPARARYFISSQYVKKIGDAPAEPGAPAESEYETPAAPASTEPAAPAETTPAITTVETPAAPAAPAETPSTPAAPVVAKPAAKKPEPGIRTEADMLRHIRMLEKALMAETAKPMDQRDMHKLLAQAREINVPEGSRFKPIYDSMVDFINDEIKLADETRSTQELVQKTLKEVSEPVKPQPARPQPPMENAVVGKLQPSRVFDRYDSAIGQVYIIRNPETNEIISFARPASSTVNLRAYVGQVVSVSGKKSFDRRAGVQVINIDNIAAASTEEVAVAKTPKPEIKTPVKTPAVETPAELPTEAPAEKPAEPEVASATEKPSRPMSPEDIGMDPSIQRPSLDGIAVPGAKPAPEPIAVTPIEATEGVGPEKVTEKPELPAIAPVAVAPDKIETPVVPPIEVPTAVAKEATEPIEAPEPVEINKLKPSEPVTAKVEAPEVPALPPVEPIAAPPVEAPAAPEVTKIETPEAPAIPAVEPIATPPVEAPAAPEVTKIETPEAPAIPDVEPIATPPVEAPAAPEVTKIEAPEAPAIPDVEPIATPPVEAPAAPEVTKVEAPETPSIPEVKPITPPAAEATEPEVAVAASESPLPEAPALKPLTVPTESPESPAIETPAVKPISVPPVVTETVKTPDEPAVAAIPVPKADFGSESPRRPKALKTVAVPTADMPVRAAATPVETVYEIEWD